MNAVEQARAAVRDLRQAVNWLAATLMPGTGKPYRAPTLTVEQRADRDRLARLERLERVGIAPGESPAPFDLDVADLLAEIMATVDELADEACRHVWRPASPPASSAFADPAPFLDLLTRLLPQAAGTSAEFPGRVEGLCDGLTERAHHLLGLLGDGQVLDATCPWCGGRTTSHPTGGGKTLRVRAQLPDGKRNVATVDPQDVRWFVVCEGLCEPGDADCGYRYRGRPAWDLRNEGTWLADRLEQAAS